MKKLQIILNLIKYLKVIKKNLLTVKNLNQKLFQ